MRGIFSLINCQSVRNTLGAIHTGCLQRDEREGFGKSGQNWTLDIGEGGYGGLFNSKIRAEKIGKRRFLNFEIIKLKI